MQDLDSVPSSKLLEFILKNQKRIMPEQWAFILLYVIDNVSRQHLVSQKDLPQLIEIVKNNISKYKQTKQISTSYLKI